MKTITRIFGMLAVLSAVIFMDACKAEKGDIGPIGPIGATGANGAIGATGTAGATGSKGDAGAKGDKGDTGATGTAGATGNANVILITYGSRTYTNTELNYNLTNVTPAQAIGSAIYCYVKSASNSYWYSLPGFTAGGTYQYRHWLNPTGAVPVFVVNRITSGIGSDVFTETKIVLIPANDLRTGRKAAIDYTDYNAVKAHYGL